MKKLVVMCLCMIFLTVSSLAFADQVFVTANGKKYHKENCRTIKNKNAKAVADEEAIAQGYEPCGRCFKANVIENNENTKTLPNKTKKGK